MGDTFLPTDEWTSTRDSFNIDDSQARKTFWEKYVTHAEVWDTNLVQRWNADLDIVLIFAGLFSAVNTAFIVEAYGALEPETAKITNALLLQVLLQLNSTLVPTVYVDQTPSLDENSVPVNSLFFASLCFSLIAAFMAVLGKQWLYQYTHPGRVKSSNEERGQIRQRRFNGMVRWHLQVMIESLPTLLQLSLVLFLVGLIMFLWPLNAAVAGVVSILTIIPIIAYIIITVLSSIRTDSPYQTPVTVALRGLWRYIGSSPILKRRALKRRFLEEYVLPAGTQNDRVDWDAMSWLLSYADDTHLASSAARLMASSPFRYADSGIFARLCALRDRCAVPDEAYSLNRAISRVGLAVANLSYSDWQLMASNFTDLASSPQSVIDQPLVHGALAGLLAKAPGQMLAEMTTFFLQHGHVPLWATRHALDSANPYFKGHQSLGTFLKTVFEARPLPPAYILVEYYVPLATHFFGTSSLPVNWKRKHLRYEPNAYDHTSLYEPYTLCFKAMRHHFSSSNDFTDIAEVILDAFFYCMPNLLDTYLGPEKYRCNTIMSFWLLTIKPSMPLEIVDNPISVKVALHLYQWSLASPLKALWVTRGLSMCPSGKDFANEEIKHTPSYISAIIRNWSKSVKPDHGLLVGSILFPCALYTHVVYERISVPPDVQHILLHSVLEMDWTDENIRNIGLAFIASTADILLASSVVTSDMTASVVESRILPAMRDLQPDHLTRDFMGYQALWYVMIINKFSREKHYQHHLFADGSIHVKNLVRNILDAVSDYEGVPNRGRKTIDGLLSVWYSNRRDVSRSTIFSDVTVLSDIRRDLYRICMRHKVLPPEFTDASLRCFYSMYLELFTNATVDVRNEVEHVATELTTALFPDRTEHELVLRVGREKGWPLSDNDFAWVDAGDGPSSPDIRVQDTTSRDMKWFRRSYAGRDKRSDERLGLFPRLVEKIS